MIVFVSPFAEQHLRLEQRLELLTVQELITKTLRGATLANDDAGSAFRHPGLLLKCNDHLLPAVRGQNIPSATNFNMSMSRA